MPHSPITAGRLWDFTTRRRTTDGGAVWDLWTTPSTWASWDRGLQDAGLAGPAWVLGARGTITDLSGRTSAFEVVEVDPGRRTTYRIALPGSDLLLQRTITGDEIAHGVRFTGPAGRLWGLVLGRRFRTLLDPTVDALLSAAAVAERTLPTPHPSVVLRAATRAVSCDRSLLFSEAAGTACRAWRVSRRG